MASPTKVYMTRIRLKMHKSGRKRKNRLARHGTTLPKSVFFGDTEPTPAPTRVAQ